MLAIMGLLTFSVVACESDPVSPPDPSLGQCLICDNGGGDDSDWGDHYVASEVVDLHNEGMDSLLVELEDAASDGPLGPEEAELVIYPRSEQFLENNDMVITEHGWNSASDVSDDVQQAIEDFKAGKDIIETDTNADVSPEAASLFRDLLQTVEAMEGTEDIDGALDELKAEGESKLSGDELEVFQASIAVARRSSEYWSNRFSTWDSNISAARDDTCVDDVVFSDVTGGIVGGLRTLSLAGAGIGALVGSGGAAVIECL